MGGEFLSLFYWLLLRMSVRPVAEAAISGPYRETLSHEDGSTELQKEPESLMTSQSH